MIAAALHAGLFAWLALRPAAAPLPKQDTVMVTLSEDVGLTSTSPTPQAAPAPDSAPELGEGEPEPALAPKPVAKVQPEPMPKPVVKPVAKPVARPVPKVAPKPALAPTPRPVAKPSPAPRASAAAPARTPPGNARPQPRPASSARPAAARPANPRPPAQRPATQRPGGSRLGDDFLKGVPSARRPGAATTPPATAIGPAVRSALAGAISRQLKPKWVAPQGAEAEKLVTILTWNLGSDGKLSGTPRVVRQEGITDANRPQAARHAEQAIRAVQLAAPFTLPAEYYDAWKRVSEFRFDRRLSQ